MTTKEITIKFTPLEGGKYSVESTLDGTLSPFFLAEQFKLMAKQLKTAGQKAVYKKIADKGLSDMDNLNLSAQELTEKYVSELTIADLQEPMPPQPNEEK